jgi:EpsI family protein
MNARSSIFRAVAAIVLLVATGVFLQARGSVEILPQPAPMWTFPQALAGWQGNDQGIDPEVAEVLGPGQFLSRIYAQRGQPYIDVFVAYFPSQRTGDTIHSPKNCLPGSGWTPIESGHVLLPVSGAPPIEANRYVIAKGHDRQLVLYWYQAHGRTVASEYWAKFYLVADSIRMRRSDGGMVRLITPIQSHESTEAAQARAVSLLDPMAAQLPNFIPQ